MFWDMAQFINKSLVSFCQVSDDYTFCEDSALDFLLELYIKAALCLSTKVVSVVIFILYCLLASKKT